jgi:hypothetical protein
LRIVLYFLAARAKYSYLFKKRESLAKHDSSVAEILVDCQSQINKMDKPPLLVAFLQNVNELWQATPRGAWTSGEEVVQIASPSCEEWDYII